MSTLTQTTSPLMMLHELLARASAQTFERALQLSQATRQLERLDYECGASSDAGVLRAVIRGRSAPYYRVRIDVGKRTWHCTCPSVTRCRARGECCKHVASLCVRLIRAPESFPSAMAPHWFNGSRVLKDAGARFEGVVMAPHLPKEHVRLRGRILAHTASALLLSSSSGVTVWVPRKVCMAQLVEVNPRTRRQAVVLAVPTWFLSMRREMKSLVQDMPGAMCG